MGGLLGLKVKEFDLVVVGAGPAGAAAAASGRRAGLSVALVDKARFPRDKLCGGLVSGRGLTALERIFGARPARDLFLVGQEAAWLWRGEELVRFRTPYELWFTKRCDFDHELQKRALAAGAEDYSGRRWQAWDRSASTLTLDGGEVLAYGGLIAADGATSKLAADLFGRAFDPEKIGFTLEVECDRAEDAPKLMEVDFRAVPWGYGWRFPKNGSLTVGVGGLHTENPDLRDALAALVPQTARQQGRVKGAFLPLGELRKDPGKANVLFVGDAAGLVDPLTGEGIAHALESGAMAAEVLAGALAAGKARDAARTYKRRIAETHRELTHAIRLRRIAYAKPFEATFRAKMQSSEWARQAFFELLEGKTSYRVLEKQITERMIAGGLAGLLKRKIGFWPGGSKNR